MLRYLPSRLVSWFFRNITPVVSTLLVLFVVLVLPLVLVFDLASCVRVVSCLSLGLEGGELIIRRAYST